MAISDIYVLPFSTKLRYPQRNRFSINGVSYDILYQWNTGAGFATATITRVKDSAICWIGKLVPQWGANIKDPATHADLFTIWANSIDSKKAEVWAAWF
jgi:hypothetical protein